VKSEEEVRWDAEQQIVVDAVSSASARWCWTAHRWKKADPANLRAAMLEGVRRLGLM